MYQTKRDIVNRKNYSCTLNKEFWANIAALVVIVGVSLICPPAGITLGAIYGTAELTSAISGKDWVSGRELDTGERVVRGVLAPIDILPAASTFRSFSGVARTSRLGNGVKDLGINIKAGMKNVETNVVQINDAVVIATQQGSMRIKNANAVVKERVKEIPNKLANKAVDAAKVVDETVANTKTFVGNLNLIPEPAFAGGAVRQSAENTHTVENSVRNIVGRVPGVNIGGSGGARGANSAGKIADDVIKDGSHFIDEFKLKPNVKYETNGYSYQTDDLGRIKKASGELQLEMGEHNSKHQLAAGGEDRVYAPSTKGDHGGHLIGTQFNGSPLIDNIVAMNGNVNVSAYKKLEYSWANALREGQQVMVDIRPIYEGQSLRPSRFEIKYKIDGKKSLEVLENIYGGK